MKRERSMKKKAECQEQGLLGQPFPVLALSSSSAGPGTPDKESSGDRSGSDRGRKHQSKVKIGNVAYSKL